MRKIVNVVSIFLVLFTLVFCTNTYAAELSSVNVTLDKTSVKVGENVKVTVAFGEDMGSYTVDVAYNSNLFEYVSATGGTANDNGTRVRVYFYDQTGGTTPSTSMSVTFKAKTGITTSTEAKFSITAEGLANADASETYDDITEAIEKTVTITPETTNQQAPATNNTTEPENKTPEKLPQTGDATYIWITLGIAAIVAVGGMYVYVKDRK